MSEEILNKIKFLCKKIAKDEWSGVLFYSIEGTIKNPGNMKVILEDILPLDKGTSAYTSYELDDRFTDYLMEDEKRMDWSIGHIHSHNVMGVFFSGTDNAELNDNAPSHNFYLSLIVNNYMEFIAKIAFVGSMLKEIKQLPYYSQDENGEKYIIEKANFNIKKDKLFVYDCLVVSPVEEVMIETGFADKVAEIMKPKPVKIYTPVPAVQTKFAGTPVPANNVAFPPKKVIPSFPKPDVSKLSGRSKTINEFIDKIPFSTFEDLTDYDELTALEKFTCELFNFTTPLAPGQNLEDILELVEDLKLDSYELATSVISNYGNLYEKHFPDADDKQFSEDGEIVLDILYDEITMYPFINVSLEAIKSMLINFEKYATATV